MTEITDEIRVGVLGALARGMSLDYAARAAGIRVNEVEEIARAAGWPDRIAVNAEWRRRRGVPAGGTPVSALPNGLGPASPPAGAPARALAPRRPATFRPDLSVARTPAIHAVTVRQAADDQPPSHVDLPALIEQLDTAPTGVFPRVHLDQPVAAAGPVLRRSYKPGQLPCEVCGGGVLESYVEKTGKQRHGHHPEAAR